MPAEVDGATAPPGQIPDPVELPVAWDKSKRHDAEDPTNTAKATANAAAADGKPAAEAAAPSLMQKVINKYIGLDRVGGTAAPDADVDWEPVRPVPAPSLVAGESVIKCPSPLNVLKDTYKHSCY